MTQTALPEWAELDGKHRTYQVIKVDAEEMYPAFMEELREHYIEGENALDVWLHSHSDVFYSAQEAAEEEGVEEGDRKPGMEGVEVGDIKQEGLDALANLQKSAEETTAYWLEVCYQMMKMELQTALRSFQIEIRVKDPEKTFRQADREDGRGADQAAGGSSGGREARHHFKELRGFIPG